MYEIRKSTLAENDLVDIWLYSYEHWGELQADKYFDVLENGIGQLRDNPGLGKACDYIRVGYRVLSVGEHLVYYTFNPSAIRIVRVLHGRMDPERYL